jgi:hypothetical protein
MTQMDGLSVTSHDSTTEDINVERSVLLDAVIVMRSSKETVTASCAGREIIIDAIWRA